MTSLTLIDTHTHLDDEQFDPDRTDVIAAARAAGVGTMINIGYRPGIWESTLALAESDPDIRYAFGLHPGSADLWSEDLFAALTQVVDENEPVAIGEIGLDYFWTTENKAIQRIAFERQIELAHSRDLPIVIHQRGAAEDVRAILANAPAGLRVVLHSFDGDQALADLARDRGWTLGVGGLATRRQAEGLRAILQDFPLDQIVLETDSPYLIPAGIKDRRNSPVNLPVIAERLAGIRNQPVEEIAAQTTANAERVFNLNLVTAHG